jgi:hypothetical protein
MEHLLSLPLQPPTDTDNVGVPEKPPVSDGQAEAKKTPLSLNRPHRPTAMARPIPNTAIASVEKPEIAFVIEDETPDQSQAVVVLI